MLDTASVQQISVVYPTSCGFVKVFSYHLFTEKPNNTAAAYCMISNKDLHPSFNISNEVMTIKSLKSAFKRLKNISNIWSNVSQKEENYLDKIFIG